MDANELKEPQAIVSNEIAPAPTAESTAETVILALNKTEQKALSTADTVIRKKADDLKIVGRAGAPEPIQSRFESGWKAIQSSLGELTATFQKKLGLLRAETSEPALPPVPTETARKSPLRESVPDVGPVSEPTPGERLLAESRKAVDAEIAAMAAEHARNNLKPEETVKQIRAKYDAMTSPRDWEDHDIARKTAMEHAALLVYQKQLDAAAAIAKATQTAEKPTEVFVENDEDELEEIELDEPERTEVVSNRKESPLDAANRKVIEAIRAREIAVKNGSDLAPHDAAIALAKSEEIREIAYQRSLETDVIDEMIPSSLAEVTTKPEPARDVLSPSKAQQERIKKLTPERLKTATMDARRDIARLTKELAKATRPGDMARQRKDLETATALLSAYGKEAKRRNDDTEESLQKNAA